MRRVASVLTIALAIALAAPARGESAVDWNAFAGVDEIEVVTTDPDGAPRETTVWLAVVAGRGYVRSSGTRWLADLEHDPDLLVRVGGSEHPLRAVRVSDSETRAAVTTAFREKYGVSDWLLVPLRSLRGVPTILRLEPRTQLAPRD